MTPLLLALTLAAPPPMPLPYEMGEHDCYTQDVREGQPVTVDCDGLLLGRARAMHALELSDYARQLQESWPEPVPWYERPGWARIEGGLVVAGIGALIIAGLQAGGR